MNEKMRILLIHNIGRAERDFHGPSYGDSFERLGHQVVRIDYDQAIPDYQFDALFHFYHSISNEKVNNLKEHHVTTVLLLGDEPCEFNRTSEFTPIYNMVFNQTGGMDNIEAHRVLGANMYPLPHCADPHRYFPVDPDPARYSRYVSDVSFIGTLTKRGDRSYIRAIRAILEAKGYTFKAWGPGTENDRWIGYEEARLIYAHSSVVFNPSAVADQPNWELCLPTLLGGPACRIFNTAACRAFQVAPRREGWFFQPFIEGEEIVYYDHRDMGSIVDTIEESLSMRVEDRYSIADAGYKRVLSEHTYDCRAAVVLQHISQYRR